MYNIYRQSCIFVIYPNLAWRIFSLRPVLTLAIIIDYIDLHVCMNCKYDIYNNRNVQYIPLLLYIYDLS